MKPNLILFFILSLIIFHSCETEKYIYQQKINVNPKGWGYTDSLEYEFNIQDTSIFYTLLMDIEHTLEYNYQNIYMDISTRYPSGKYMNQVLSSDFADKSGRWYGKCSGDQCLAPINLQSKTKFPEPGNYNINIKQFSRDSALLEISRITLKLQEYKSEEIK